MKRWMIAFALALSGLLLGGCATLAPQQRAQAAAIAIAARSTQVDCARADACALASPLRALGERTLAESSPGAPRHRALILDGGPDALLAPEVTRRVIARFAAGELQNSTDSAGSGPTSRAPARSGGGSMEFRRPAPGAPPLPELTEREDEVLRLVAQALSNAEIAQRLYIGEATVKTHVSNVLQKLGARDRVAAVVWAYRHGLA